jgi:hypothetical protein
MEPVSDIIYPVIDCIDNIQIIDNDDDNDASGTSTCNDNENKVVSVLAVTFYWRDALKNILPSNKKGLVVVVRNPCAPSFTYLVE